MDQPLVTILTPSFNQAEFLEATIRSVLGQSYPNIEYIIMDGGSTDGSKAIIERYTDRLAHWQSESDKGQTDAINKGFARATGKYMAWLNSDDIYEPHAVAEAVEFLEAHPEVGLVYGDANYINAGGNVIGRFPAAQTDLPRLRRAYVHIPQQAAFWRTDLWQKVGPLDPSLYFAMDYDLWVRLAQISEIVYHPRVWANFRLHGSSKTLVSDSAWQEMLKVHFRDGGRWFAPIVLLYYVRKAAAPLLRLRMQSRLRQP